MCSMLISYTICTAMLRVQSVISIGYWHMAVVLTDPRSTTLPPVLIAAWN